MPSSSQTMLRVCGELRDICRIILFYNEYKSMDRTCFKYGLKYSIRVKESGKSMGRGVVG